MCLLVDLADRGIVGHSAGRTRDASLVLGAFATLDFPPADVQVFHTDRGGEFDNTRIDEPLDVFGIKRSLSRKGNPYDNAVVESTNRLLKKELVYRNSYATIEQLRHDLNDYVWWSDNQRLHSGSTPPLDTGVRRNSPNRDSSSKKPSNTPLPIHVMNIGLEAGHTYHIRLVVDDTIGTLYVDGVALNVRMYERPGESLGVFATDGTVEVRNASIARGLKRK